MNIHRCILTFRFRKLCILALFSICLFCIFSNHIEDTVEDKYSKPKITYESCPIPDLEDFLSYSNYRVDPQTLICSNKLNFITVEKGIVYVKARSICQYRCIYWYNDFFSNVHDSVTLNNGTKVPCTFFITTCNLINSEEIFTEFFTVINRDSNLLERASCKAAFDDLFDILIVGVGSLSYNGWKHMLPETFNQFHNSLDGVSFKKFNSLGDGSTANIQALLTGTKDIEVYESRRRILLNDYIDEYNWIWKYLKRRGYLTSFVDENSMFGTFQYRLRGFKNQPTDFYMRSAFLAARVHKLTRDLCFTSKSIHKAIFDFQNQFDDVYSVVPKFSFMFLSRYSSDNSFRFLDNDLAEFIVNAKKKNPNLFIVLYSDDGRFMNRKSLMVEKYEVRLPFMGISLPERIKDRRPVLERNSRILTTSFDLHATLEDLIGIYKPINGTRHMSLLRPLPEHRNCMNLDIFPHWCSCFEWKKLRNPSSHVNIINLARQAVRIISAKSSFLRNTCEELELDNIIDAYSMAPSADVLKFKKSADLDGFVPDMSDNTKQDIFWYQIDLMTKPGGITFRLRLAAQQRNQSDSNRFVILKLESKDIIKLNNIPKLEGCLRGILKNNLKLLNEIERFCICKNVNN